MLAKSGHAVTVVGNGGEAIAAVEREPFDVVLMDVQMPEVDGFEAAASIRKAEAGTGRRIPIIALTAHASEEIQNQCLGTGMDACACKPIQEDQLLAAIARCLAPRIEE
jgi:CheY-like chemotaxis protein